MAIEYINMHDLLAPASRDFKEVQIAAFGNKVVKVKMPNPGEYTQLEQLSIKYAKELSSTSQLNGFIAVILFAYGEDERRLFPDVKEGIKTLNEMPWARALQLVQAVLTALPDLKIPEDSIVELAKKSEADA